MSGHSTLAGLGAADRTLVEAARDASRNAYAPYSGFAVGAAVRARSGAIYVGANLENAAYGVTMCGEVGAITAANTAGDLNIEAIAVVGHRFLPPADASHVVTPCGRCRQLISEAAQLAGADVRVISCSGDLHQIDKSTISQLLPAAFGPANLGPIRNWPNLQQTLYAAVTMLARDAPRPA
jgi:cytidine deaminase